MTTTETNIFATCPGLANSYNPYSYAFGYLRSAMQSLEMHRNIFANNPERFYEAVDRLIVQANALDAAMKEVLAKRA